MKNIIAIVFTIISIQSIAQNNPDAILGKWITHPKRNLMVEVYKDRAEYKARIVWFSDKDDPSKPMTMRMDENNPDPAMRKRKILGMEVLRGMIYNVKLNRWESGKIYDAKSGRVWSSSAWLTSDNILKVRGFWHFEFIGENLNFKRV
jgi:uncharacterized protein (DUF2147 family)